MLWMILGLGLLMGLTIFLMYVAVRWASAQVTGDLARNLHAGETVVNQQSVPADWSRPHQRRLRKLEAAGAGPADLNAAAEDARAHVLRKLDDLIRFYEKTNVVDSPETRRFLLAALREQHTRWQTLEWRKLFATDSTATPVSSP